MTTINAQRTVRAAHVPPATRVYAIGDIHGRADLLADLIERIDEDLLRRPIEHAIEVYLGDYVDRGGDSKTVIDILCRRLVQRNAICLRGNHEALLEEFLHDPEALHDWMRLGAANTLTSYGVSISSNTKLIPAQIHRAFCDVFPRTHVLFLQCLHNLYTCGEYLFVHAGIRPGVP